MKFNLHPENPELRKIRQISEILADGGVIISPTDSVYALVCDMENQKAVDKICMLRQLDPKKANLTFLCESISSIATFTAPIQNEIFRLIKRNTPGPFTFILKSNPRVPKRFKNKKRTIGARIPQHVFLEQLMTHYDKPLMSATLKLPDEEFHTADIDEIYSTWGNRVGAVIECGVVPNKETAIVDCTSTEFEILRTGPKELQV